MKEYIGATVKGIADLKENIGATVKMLANLFWSYYVWWISLWNALAPDSKNIVLYSITFTLGFIILRFVVERLVLAPIGGYFGLKNGRFYRPAQRTKSEAAYRRRVKPSQFADFTIERWFRLRTSYYEPSPRMKFCDRAWRFIFYISNIFFGLYVLRNKAWLWDIEQWFARYRNHGVTNDVWWYYTISSAFYWSLMISQFWDVRRNDFWQMLVTIALLSFSWVCNLHRIGTLVLLIWNFSGILEMVWLAKYMKLFYLVFVMYVIFRPRVSAEQFHAISFILTYVIYVLLCLLLLWLIVSICRILFSIIRKKLRYTRSFNYVSKRVKRKSSYQDTANNNNDSTNLNKLRLEADVNEQVDRAISQLVTFIHTYKPDRMELPDVVEGNEFKLMIYDGYLRGLGNVVRSGGQRVKYHDNKLSIQLQFQFTNLKVEYNYLVQALIINTTGEIEGSLARFTIVFNLLIDLNNDKPFYLQEFSIIDISDLRVQLTGNMLIDTVVNPISQLFTNIFFKTIIEVVQSNIKSAIQDGLDFINTNKMDIIQCLTLYTVFKQTQVTNIIADRYFEWRRQRQNINAELSKQVKASTAK